MDFRLDERMFIREHGVQFEDHLIDVIVKLARSATNPEGQYKAVLLHADGHCDHIRGNEAQQCLHGMQSHLILSLKILWARQGGPG